MRHLRLHLSDPSRIAPSQQRPRLGRMLVDNGTIHQRDLIDALHRQRRIDAPMGEILVAEGRISRAELMRAVAKQHNLQLVDLTLDPPSHELAIHLSAQTCLKSVVVPWMMMGDTLLVATSRPDTFEDLRKTMGDHGKRMLPVIADAVQIRDQIGRLYGAELAQKAATRVPENESCRGMQSTGQTNTRLALALCALLGLALLLAPFWTLTVAILWAFVTLLMTTALKLAAFCAQARHEYKSREDTRADNVTPLHMPKVSMMVPLLKETEIAGALINRLSRLTYPKFLLDIVLVLEEGDTLTRETIARTELPDWISVIEVPAGDNLTTKPRAMNYAMDFCEGSIIGVWDAEDSPEPDQIEKVVSRFHQAPADVVCLQGVLDYYNTKSNWISRCFTIEYATWWRVLLPGVARLGMVIPLGGTTVFFRRDKLEELCGWDAHNVTEDADLGVRLARHGYRTELLPTVTFEEANCRAWPWVKQRSRWLKGFFITWIVHMREPRQLLRDLGWKKFLGVQTMLLATFSQFASAPLLWSFWLTLFGVAHPISHTLGTTTLWAMIGVFIAAELINLTVSIYAVWGKRHRHLVGWVLSMPLYFTMGALAAHKALYECISKPFYWDKTQHGVTKTEQTEAGKPALPATVPAPVPVLTKSELPADLPVFRRHGKI